MSARLSPDLNSTRWFPNCSHEPKRGRLTKHICTVEDLIRFGAGLLVESSSCGATRTLNGHQVVKLGGAQPLGALSRRLKCSLCGCKDARLVVLPPL